MKMKAVFTGTFDPITNGHVDIIKRAATMFDDLHVLLCINSEKKGMFTAEQRAAMVKLACDGIDNVKVAICEGLLTEYTEKNDIPFIVEALIITAKKMFGQPYILINNERVKFFMNLLEEISNS
jgi:pantetheine-phosphate adenylyltransferase